MEKATFGAGCFWGVEAAFRRLAGVKSTAVGYAGGKLDHPTYEDVCTDRTGHAEVVEVTFDPAVISYHDLLEVFWNNHNPTTLNRQGPDVGDQYRCAIFFHWPEQEAEAKPRAMPRRRASPRPIVTEIMPAQTFWRAEEYHQQYLEKRGLALPYISRKIGTEPDFARAPPTNQAPSLFFLQMKIGFVSLGCPKNLVDTEVMMGQLTSGGHELTPHPSDADVIVVNTCSFIDPAKQESIDTILEMAEYKKTGRAQKLIVAGCLVERHRGDIQKNMPEVDAVIGTNELDRITALCEGLEPKDNPLDAYLYHDLTPRVLSTPKHYAYIKIAEGCDHPCTFCVIPQYRGHFRSRRFESVISEATRLFSQGVREINLIGQDTTCYGEDFGLKDGSGATAGPPRADRNDARKMGSLPLCVSQ